MCVCVSMCVSMFESVSVNKQSVCEWICVCVSMCVSMCESVSVGKQSVCECVDDRSRRLYSLTSSTQYSLRGVTGAGYPPPPPPYPTHTHNMGLVP